MLRILIVDDNATNMKLAADVLADSHCTVVCASDAEEAQQLLRDELPDLILMDVSMPGTDGLTLTRRLKMDERFRTIPIIALTASAMKGDDQKAFEAGCSGYITKPIDTRRFKRQVLAFLPPEKTLAREDDVRPAAGEALRILVVDDSSRNRKLLRAGLENERCTVLEAANGRDALEILAEGAVDAVVSDILMPRMDGFRLCREMRGSNAAFASVPFLLYTATYDSPQDRQLAKSVGADDYLLKPAPVAVILDSIRRAQVSAARHARIAPTPQVEAEVLEQYNAALVRKLETRNHEVQEAFTQLQSAHEHILELNRFLEMRVEQRTAALDAANRELESFSYSVAHDLRAPLHQIAGFADLLRETLGTPTAESAEFLDRIISATRRMDQLIVDLLAFARTARTELTLREVNLEQTLDEALEAVRPDFAGRKINWKRESLPHVRGDAALLRQVYINLLSNAIKYTRSRTEATIQIGHRVGRAHELVLYVRDNGIGFDMQHARSLFGVFQRLHGATDYEGTGIGLANVQRIITRHGGRVWAEAMVDRGATFYFTLPPADIPDQARH